MIGAGQVNKEEEADKVTVVVEANAVVHPWTVVILDAPVKLTSSQRWERV